MAKATVEEKVIVKTVTLILSVEEAQTLQTVTGFIGGNEDDSPRMHMKAIAGALRPIVGGEWDDMPQYRLVRRNSAITFDPEW
jgi:hypothetical protein